MIVKMNGNDISGLIASNGKSLVEKFMENGKVGQYHNEVIADKTFLGFLNDWHHDGFWIAMYDKPFFQVLKDFTSKLCHDIGIFLLSNGDLFFLLPAIAIMLGTFTIGRNKYTKWIIPLWFAYFLTRFFYHMIL